MSTPMKHAASQQGRTPSQLAVATPPVSTPFSNPAHAAFSPRNSRSSPQQVKKSPATSTLLGQSTTGALNFDSPSAAAAMGALGIGGAFEMGLDNVGVAGLDGLSVGFSSEDDKVKRLDTILALLNKKRGLVSEAGLERLAQRLGLEFLSEENIGPDGRKSRTLVIAGSAIALDIALDNNVVQNISLAFHGSPPSVARHADAASQILLKDLQLAPNQSPLTKTLDQFAKNFEWLANLDKLSISPGLDCQEALAGIFASLERLNKWDMTNLREEPAMAGKSDEYISSAAMCTRHGYPAMHCRGKLGLALQYWRELRHVPASDSGDQEDKVWSLLLGCAPINGLGQSPVRVSENWISKDIVKPDPTAIGEKKGALDWQEPDNVILPPSEENKDAGMELLQPDLSTTRVPRVMFTATFDPPVKLPQNEWMRLYAYAQAEPPNLNALDFSHRPPPTFDSMVFPIPPGTKQDPSEARTITRVRQVRVFDEANQPVQKTHHNKLFIYKPIYSQEVKDLAFSHPRQLVDMLPLLRQYAFLSILLENSFGSNTQDPVATKDGQAKAGTGQGPGTTMTRDEFTDFSQPAPTLDASQISLGGQGDSRKTTHMDVILGVHPVPQIQVVFPLGSSTGDITLRILEGGTVEVMDENILAQDGRGGPKGNGKTLTRGDLARVLEHLEDLCKWVEWISLRVT
ncbi:hypothetical protein S40288_04911 [Stachybotrys chartarum IBT 40288]|nr:hypothetical protein S40288_04911 [Stachybotrys chartarum IBT 40288]